MYFADADGRVWTAIRFVRKGELTPLQKALGWLQFRPPTIPVDIEVSEVEGDPLGQFKSVFLEALEKDDDIIPQWNTPERIKKGVECADTLPRLIEGLRKAKAI